MSSAISSPITSSASYPNVRSAAGLNAMIVPVWSIATTASSAASSIARVRWSPRCAASCARRRSTETPIWSPSVSSVRSSSASGARGSVASSSMTATTPRPCARETQGGVQPGLLRGFDAREVRVVVDVLDPGGSLAAQTQPGRPSPA